MCVCACVCHTPAIIWKQAHWVRRPVSLPATCLAVLSNACGFAELNRALIQDMLPPFIVVQSVTCDRLALKIPWARLKSKPVKVMVSTVNLVVTYDPSITEFPSKPSACSKADAAKAKAKKSAAAENDPKFGVGGKYGLIDAVRRLALLSITQELHQETHGYSCFPRHTHTHTHKHTHRHRPHTHTDTDHTHTQHTTHNTHNTHTQSTLFPFESGLLRVCNR